MKNVEFKMKNEKLIVKMKKNLLIVAGLAAGWMLAACSSDDKTDTVLDEPYDSLANIEQIIDGCIDIASEVGNAKIGDPYDLYTSGKTEEALYAVESWFSWHSRDDYSNNILSIRNAYFGSTSGSAVGLSLSALVQKDNTALDTEVKQAIDAAYKAIQAIPQPFRSNINSSEARAAMSACDDLEQTLSKLKTYFQQHKTLSDGMVDPVIKTYVEGVVLPTYSNLKSLNAALYQAVSKLQKDPSDANFQSAANAWLAARQPWETSEAFLFGPVDSEGLDPNMDSWPLDVDAIVNILNSGNYDDLNWADGDSDDAVEAAQSVRGFHTLEFLLFKNGKPRTTHDGNATSGYDIDYTEANAASWLNYAVQVAGLLQKDAADLEGYWSTDYKQRGSYASIFLSHDF